MTALNHQEPDRVPFDLGSTGVTGIHIIAYQRLRKYLGLPEGTNKIYDPIQQLALVEEDVVQRLGIDTRPITRRLPPTSITEDSNSFSFYDDWYVQWQMPKDSGFYFDAVSFPLQYAETVEEVEKFSWPNFDEPERYKGLREELKAIVEQTGCIVVAQDICPGFSETAARLLGMEKFLTDLILNPKVICAVMDKIIENKKQYWQRMLTEGKGYIDIVQQGEDLGTQESLLMSPELYRKYIKPRQKELYAFIKKLAPVKIFFHSCGAIRELIPDFIEVGIDILNPIQLSAAGMNDTAGLKKEFGKYLTFWGGGIETQRILPYANPQTIKYEVRRRIEDLAPGGGFIFATVHNIQPEVPPENIVAMWEALQEYGRY
ncbi:uroporphyrinogen decarboxylase [Thermanaeromonas toyohensis ToBE]|uniref:Uroporphyrinogen decarboxylase n=1 Tax=Thermanaeromonas toyohensis ToBE TaxID=698762 RepID=A0A1W1VV81_9FIRM|nr:uroporphyrinogen decarboxylase [Thermanaeromonas toyohensis ToBE]